jgi:hypothetical protein
VRYPLLSIRNVLYPSQIAGHHLAQLGNKTWSKLYVRNVADVFKNSILNLSSPLSSPTSQFYHGVTLQENGDPDSDLCFMVNADLFVKGGGGYSAVVDLIRTFRDKKRPRFPIASNQNWWKSSEFNCLQVCSELITCLFRCFYFVVFPRYLRLFSLPHFCPVFTPDILYGLRPLIPLLLLHPSHLLSFCSSQKYRFPSRSMPKPSR